MAMKLSEEIDAALTTMSGVTTTRLGAWEASAKALEERCEQLSVALLAAKLHLMVRPHNRLPAAEENVKAIINAALADAAQPDVGSSGVEPSPSGRTDPAAASSAQPNTCATCGGYETSVGFCSLCYDRARLREQGLNSDGTPITGQSGPPVDKGGEPRCVSPSGNHDFSGGRCAFCNDPPPVAEPAESPQPGDGAPPDGCTWGVTIDGNHHFYTTDHWPTIAAKRDELARQNPGKNVVVAPFRLSGYDAEPAPPGELIMGGGEYIGGSIEPPIEFPARLPIRILPRPPEPAPPGERRVHEGNTATAQAWAIRTMGELGAAAPIGNAPSPRIRMTVEVLPTSPAHPAEEEPERRLSPPDESGMRKGDTK